MTSQRSGQPKTGSLAKPAKRSNRRSLPIVEANDSDSSELSDASDDEQQTGPISEPSESEGESNDDQEDEYTPSKRKFTGRKAGTKRGPKTTKKVEAPSKAAPKSSAPKRKQRSAAVGAGRPRRGGNKEHLPINKDNKLFNAVCDVDSDLRAVAEDWMVYYQDNYPAALAQFINFVLRVRMGVVLAICVHILTFAMCCVFQGVRK